MNPWKNLNGREQLVRDIAEGFPLGLDQSRALEGNRGLGSEGFDHAQIIFRDAIWKELVVHYQDTERFFFRNEGNRGVRGQR